MPSVKNETKLAQIKEDLEGAGAVWVVDACGLTVKETQALRQAVREAGASMKVYKNTLMHIALADAELPTLDDMLHGPSAFVFAGDDVAAALLLPDWHNTKQFKVNFCVFIMVHPPNRGQ